MKKTKILTPLLVASSLGAIIAPAMILTSCNNSDISLDSTTAKEQSTTSNVTSATYAFNVKNYSEAEDEIETEITDTDTKDEVSVEISKTYYDSETKKFYVIVTISKENGELNDQEQIQFSINFKCHKKGQSVYKWTNKIEKFVVKHNLDGLAHFDSTDVNKTIYTKAQGKQQITYNFPIAGDEYWTKDGADETYSLAKLHIYANQGPMSRLMPITIDEKVAFELVGDTIGEQYLKVTIDADTTQAHEGTHATYNLLFTYDEEGESGQTREAVFQIMGGFRIVFGNEPEVEHTSLFGSRERHVYKLQHTEGSIAEDSTNFVSFILDSLSYNASDFTVTSSNNMISIGNLSIYEIKGESNFNILVVPYTVADRHQRFDYGETNVTLTIKYNNEDPEKAWTQTFKGLSFLSTKGVTYDKPILKCDQNKVLTTLKVGSKIEFADLIETISPFDISDVIYSTATFNSDGTDYKLDFSVDELYWDIGTEKSVSKCSLDLNGQESLAGKTGKITYKILVKTATASYYYELSTELTLQA